MPVAASQACRNYERTVIGNSPHHYWGLRLGEGNRRKWAKVNKGDYIIFRGAWRYSVCTRITGKKQDGILAQSLWGTDKKGFTWDLMFELSPPRPISVSVKEYEAVLGVRAGAFERVAHQRLAVAFSTFGKDKFLQSFGIEESCLLNL